MAFKRLEELSVASEGPFIYSPFLPANLGRRRRRKSSQEKKVMKKGAAVGTGRKQINEPLGG